SENRAVVEFGPFQKTPKEHKKPDPRQGTIESGMCYSLSLPFLFFILSTFITHGLRFRSTHPVDHSIDPDFIAFLESLKAEEQRASEPKDAPGTDGLSQLEKLENRLANVTGMCMV
ncbi:hypothetical protein BC938DRAFT_478813, partial [Jimgerdemannia flammicorona]